jgi:hypothetical protein
VSLPKLDGVRESTISEFLRLAAGNVTTDDKNPLPKILETEGRCIRVHVTGFSLSWHHLAEDLIGPFGPCVEFRVQGNFINARLKTDTQRAADDLAFDIDEAHGRQIVTMPLFDSESLPAEPRTARQRGQARGKKPARQVPEGLASGIMKTMKRHCAAGSIDIGEIVQRVKDSIPKKLDSEGKDRRARNIRLAIDKLVSQQFLFLHGEDQDEVSLSTTILEDDDGEDTDA